MAKHKVATSRFRILTAEYVDSLPRGSVYTARDYILYVFDALVVSGIDERDAIVTLAASEIKRRHRELRDPKIAKRVYVIDTYLEDNTLESSELRVVQHGKLR